ncbi:adenylate cyclase-activating dopamine receptor signaling pathway [Homalodisca vitripennis]|nr:adenylate cyclase-activating dopamine receptor signaling pathway [Homalodisca vitripennis]
MLTTVSQICIGTIVCLLISASVAGNTLVCLAIYKNSKLRRVENLFLASLAVSDLLVAVLVMTFAGVNDVLGYWVFGPTLCSVWICVDIMCSTASILNLCAISLERYLHVKDPFQYTVMVTKKTVVSSIGALWIVSAVISVFPVSMGIHHSSIPKNPSSSCSCVMDLSPVYAVVSSILSFCLPCVVMVSIYSRLYLTSRRHYKTIALVCHPGDHKAPLTIGVLMGIFLVCWLPFFCANILVAFCKTCVSPGTFKVFTWLGYSNSMFNPIVYTVLNTDFRDFLIVLLLRNRSSQQKVNCARIRTLNFSFSNRAMVDDKSCGTVLDDKLTNEVHFCF